MRRGTKLLQEAPDRPAADPPPGVEGRMRRIGNALALRRDR
jgi:hypothetical protein